MVSAIDGTPSDTSANPVGSLTARASTRSVAFAWVWLVIIVAVIGATIYLNRDYVLHYPVGSSLIIGIAMLSAATRISVATLRVQLSLGLSLLALSLLFPGSDESWAVYGIWSLGVVLGVTWVHKNPLTCSFMVSIAMAAGAVLVAVRASIPAIGRPVPVINENGQSVAITISMLSAFFVVTIFAAFVLRVQMGMSLADLAFAVSWSRFSLVVLCQTAGAFVGYGLAVKLSEWMTREDTLASFRSPMLVMLLFVAFYSVGGSIRRSTTHTRREEALVTSLTSIPWPNTVSVEQQAQEQLSKGLVGFQVSTVRTTRHDGPARGDGRLIVSAPVQDDKGTFVATIRRGPFSRPFSVSDRRYIDAIMVLAQESVRAEREIALLRSASNTDPMTGLQNYRALRANLALLENEDKDEGICALVFLNLQDLSVINSENGHLVGDEVIREVASRLSEATKNWENASAYRIAGDEFGILVVGLKSKADAEKLTWEIDSEISQPVTTGEGPITVSIAQTVSFANVADVNEVAGLITRADQQLYTTRRKYINVAADSAGEEEFNDYELQDAPTASVAVGPSAAIIEAIRLDQLRQVYEPIVDRTVGRIVALEASVRFTDPRYGQLPVAFLRTETDRLGLRTKMATQVMQHAVADMERFRVLYPELVRLHLNISPVQLVDREFTLQFEELRAEHSELEIVLELDADTVRVAPTETSEKAASYAVTNDVLIALDNAGTNYSELAALIVYPVKIVKLSEKVLSLIREKRTREATSRYIRAMKDTGVQMIVTGVSRVDEVKFIEETGFNRVEGPLYSNPVSASEFLVRLETLGLNIS